MPQFEVRETSVPLENPNFEIWYGGALRECHVPTEWQLASAPQEPSPDQVAAAQRLIEQPRDCSYWIDTYWGYQLCHNATIRQIHPKQEGDQFLFSDKMPGFHLGNRTGEASAVMRDGVWHYKAPYDFGSVCDLTGSDRSVEVYYYCDPDIASEKIKHVRETHICVYEVLVAAPQLCGVFESAQDSVNVIECYNPEMKDDPDAQVVQDYLEKAEDEATASAVAAGDALMDELFEGIVAMFGGMPETGDPDILQKYDEWLARTGDMGAEEAQGEARGEAQTQGDQGGPESKAEEVPEAEPEPSVDAQAQMEAASEAVSEASDPIQEPTTVPLEVPELEPEEPVHPEDLPIEEPVEAVAEAVEPHNEL